MISLVTAGFITFALIIAKKEKISKSDKEFAFIFFSISFMAAVEPLELIAPSITYLR